MSEKQKMVVVVTQGFQDERASVAWSVANGGVGMGFEVTMFLVSSGVDWVRKGADDLIESVTLAGSPAMLGVAAEGAIVLTF